MAQGAVNLPCQIARRKLMWVWWVFNGASGCGKFVRALNRMGMELKCKFSTYSWGQSLAFLTDTISVGEGK
eukprot:scaffold170313_cov18-Tisochrysis_lutea.AAC.1